MRFKRVPSRWRCGDGCVSRSVISGVSRGKKGGWGPAAGAGRAKIKKRG